MKRVIIALIILIAFMLGYFYINNAKQSTDEKQNIVQTQNKKEKFSAFFCICACFTSYHYLLCDENVASVLRDFRCQKQKLLMLK